MELLWKKKKKKQYYTAAVLLLHLVYTVYFNKNRTTTNNVRCRRYYRLRRCRRRRRRRRRRHRDWPRFLLWRWQKCGSYWFICVPQQGGYILVRIPSFSHGHIYSGVYDCRAMPRVRNTCTYRCTAKDKKGWMTYYLQQDHLRCVFVYGIAGFRARHIQPSPLQSRPLITLR